MCERRIAIGGTRTGHALDIRLNAHGGWITVYTNDGQLSAHVSKDAVAAVHEVTAPRRHKVRKL